MIRFGCCVGDHEKLAKWVLPSIRGAPLIGTYNQTNIIDSYNAILDGLTYRIRDGDILVLVHDDLEITDPDAFGKIEAAFEDPMVALAGVAGGGHDGICPELFWWGHDPVGHQVTDVMSIDFGRREGDVTLVEGSLMALSSWAVRALRFDERFADCDYHGYDEIGAQVWDAGFQSVVVDVDTHHHNPMGYRSAESAAAAQRANALYREKWGLG
jgi:hypothetical protein